VFTHLSPSKERVRVRVKGLIVELDGGRHTEQAEYNEKRVHG
jgi:very-short-patch-repair endonuclease